MKKLMVKAAALFVAAVMAFSLVLPAAAADGLTPAEKAHLSFDKNGNFRVLILADMQDDALRSLACANFMRKAAREYSPDLVVLLGDIIMGMPDPVLNVLRMQEVMNCFLGAGVPVAAVFGNHEMERGKPSKETLMKVINSYPYSISYDEGDALYGCGTYNVPIYESADSDKVCANLFMIDSGDYDDVHGGYDYVHEDQIQWFKDKSDELALANGGQQVPSFVFQHIIVPEIYDALKQVPEGTEGAIARGGRYYVLPDNAAEGSVLGEGPCPGTYNAGEFAAVKQQGNVSAMFFAHDHTNSFVVPYEGIDLVATAACGYRSYGDPATRGARIVDIKSDGSYETSTFLYGDLFKNNPIMLFIEKVDIFIWQLLDKLFF